ncbi:aminotransferase class V-fold PLP-dependent enzyme [Sphingomonas sp. CA1-15]|uniref:Cysteine desulfurase n=1 Tax=Sphingomonas immobilis TaxID=3063997 RepID=A0ABT9A152_9SPHN|nr:aminotransferase class V-fold PLP-dependent enzyme [Sphingomonas sp. CA1-15]MDO7843556.1 aminotransferase class V-fold PLP-dependent enzyme [Sphingomonas sp. CA1-15]
MAATPVDPRVADRHRAAMLDNPGNAHSAEHAVGVAARQALDAAGEAVLRAIESREDVVTFTPGASAALWLAVEDAIARTVGRVARVAATAVEHPALLSALRHAERGGRLQLTILPVDAQGAPVVEALATALRDSVDLVCTMAANNEVGTITDLAHICAVVRAAGARHLVDASQAAGRLAMPALAKADLIVVSGAKLYGPRRSGALIGALCGHAETLAHDVFGSPDVPAAVALAYALDLRVAERDADETRLAYLRDRLQADLTAAVPDLRINGDPTARLAGSLHISTPHLPGEAVVARLWGKVAVSTGAACQSGAPGPSHVLSAMDMPDWARDGAVRIGLGRFNSAEEVAEAGALIASALTLTLPARRYA